MSRGSQSGVIVVRRHSSQHCTLPGITIWKQAVVKYSKWSDYQLSYCDQNKSGYIEFDDLDVLVGIIKWLQIHA